MQYVDLPAAYCMDHMQNLQYGVVRKMRILVRKVDKIKYREFLIDRE
jgi:hypothetical protein